MGKSVRAGEADSQGGVLTYGGLARAVKLRGGARAAGRAMAACPKGRGIPWHRVVGAQGRILIREPQAGFAKAADWRARECGWQAAGWTWRGTSGLRADRKGGEKCEEVEAAE